MIRCPDLDLPSIPASTSSLRTLLNPEARNAATAADAPQTEASLLRPGSRGQSPTPSEEPDHQSEEDKRYYEIRARQMLQRRPSMTEH